MAALVNLCTTRMTTIVKVSQWFYSEVRSAYPRIFKSCNPIDLAALSISNILRYIEYWSSGLASLLDTCPRKRIWS